MISFKKKKTVITTIPFLLLASYLILNASNFPGGSFEAYWFAQQIYKLGFPLTWIVIYLPRFTDVPYPYDIDLLLVIALNSLFIIQWVLWARLIEFLKNKLMSKKN